MTVKKITVKLILTVRTSKVILDYNAEIILE